MTPLLQRRRIRIGALVLHSMMSCMLAQSAAVAGAEAEIQFPVEVFVHDAYFSIDGWGIVLLVGAVLILIAGCVTGVVLSLRRSRKL